MFARIRISSFGRVLGIVFALLMNPVLLADADEASAEVSMSASNIGRLMWSIRSEARKALKDQQWPQAEGHVVDQPTRQSKIDDAALLRLLQRRHDSNPSIDAFMRWRLMSFRPNFTQASDDDLRKLVASMPKIRRQPRPQPPKPNLRRGEGGGGVSLRLQNRRTISNTGRRRVGRANSRLSVGTSGVSLGVGGAVNPNNPRYVLATVEASNARLDRLRQVSQFRNVPVLRFRDAIVDALPADSGAKLIGAMQDALDRIEAGDLSFGTAVDRVMLIDVGGLELNEEQYKQAMTMIRRLAKRQTRVVESWTLVDDKLVRREFVVAFQRWKLRTLLEQMRGAAVPETVNRAGSNEGQSSAKPTLVDSPSNGLR